MAMFVRWTLASLFFLTLITGILAMQPTWTDIRFDVWTWPSVVQRMTEQQDWKEQLLARQEHRAERAQRLDAAVMYFVAGEIDMREATARVRRLVRRSEWVTWADYLDIPQGSDEARLRNLVLIWRKCFEKRRTAAYTSCTTQFSDQ